MTAIEPTFDETYLKSLGFEVKEWFDKNGKDDKVYSLKFVEYYKQVGDDAFIEICFCYFTENGTDYILIENSIELRIGTEYLSLKIDKMHQIMSLYKLITGKRITK